MILLASKRWLLRAPERPKPTLGRNSGNSSKNKSDLEIFAKMSGRVNEGAGPSGSGSVDRMAERKAKLAALHRKRNESRQLNHAEVVEEDRRSKEPKNMEVRRSRRNPHFLDS